MAVMLYKKTACKCLSYKQTNEDMLLGIREWSRVREGRTGRVSWEGAPTWGTYRMVCIQFCSIAENLIGKSVKLLDGSWKPGH